MIPPTFSSTSSAEVPSDPGRSDVSRLQAGDGSKSDVNHKSNPQFLKPHNRSVRFYLLDIFVKCQRKATYDALRRCRCFCAGWMMTESEGLDFWSLSGGGKVALTRPSFMNLWQRMTTVLWLYFTYLSIAVLCLTWVENNFTAVLTFFV